MVKISRSDTDKSGVRLAFEMEWTDAPAEQAEALSRLSRALQEILTPAQQEQFLGELKGELTNLGTPLRNEDPD